MTVRRAGLMARLGHERVVATHALAGYAAPGLGRADVAFRLDEMTVDEPHLLRDAGIATQPAPEAVEGTRKNMLGPVLDAERYPVVTLHVERPAEAGCASRSRCTASRAGWNCRPRCRSTRRRWPNGTARLKQTDFGITPFAVGAGLLAVQDELEVGYDIVARRWTPPVNKKSRVPGEDGER